MESLFLGFASFSFNIHVYAIALSIIILVIDPMILTAPDLVAKVLFYRRAAGPARPTPRFVK